MLSIFRMADSLRHLLEKIRSIQAQLFIVEVHFQEFLDAMTIFEQEMEEFREMVQSITPPDERRVLQPHNQPQR